MNQNSLTKPFLAMEVLERAHQLQKDGREILYMCVGEPDLPVHPKIEEACIKAIKEGKTRYTHSLGILELREAISNYYKKKYSIDVSPERIVVSSGTSPLMLLIFSILNRRVNKIVLTNPCYACYPTYVSFTCGDIEYFPLSPKGTDYSKLCEIKSKNYAVVINSPSNPTGEMINTKDLEFIGKLGVPVVSDEIYHGLCYERDEDTMLKFGEEVFVINGFSKAFSMTGWRLGYCIVPEKYIRELRSLHQNIIICAPSFVQWAGVSALEYADEIQSHMKEVFSKRRKILLEGLKALNLSFWGNPEGAFYVLVDFRFLKKDSLTISMELLEKYGLAVTPGIDFGSQAEGFIRFSYATSEENIGKALEKLEKFIKNS
ncbi:MAG: aminotransferase class I/II-fold pyridoxal phosphate-dependent enzyme [Proteobacteria bacterium]|nr:aminotransferase class I/II-fold pyridoxal phosphate-dependent enzyme [Pseudomonadota bacterium]